jgi:hypothetical protein
MRRDCLGDFLMEICENVKEKRFETAQFLDQCP